MTAICVPIFINSKSDVEEAIGEAEEALAGMERGEAMMELRCDTATPRQMMEAIDGASVPVIVTIRPTWEGGFSTKGDKERLGMWEQAMEAGAEYVDVELAAWEKSGAIREMVEDVAEKNGTRLVVSNHCFERRPKDLRERVERLRAVKAARVLKIVWKAESLVDGVEALRLSREVREADGRGVVALAMGEEGLISRLLAKKFGMPFTFAAMETGKESAPGQPTVRELRERYRWGKQGAETKVFGVAGWPVGHSLSPHIHNGGFEAMGVDGVYAPLAIRGEYEAFAGAVKALRECPGMELRGMSVTIPHKENAMRYARENGGTVEELAEHIGVINTLMWDEAGKLSAFNFDYAGAMDALVSAWGDSRELLRGKKVAVLGAGGAARAIVAGLAAYGAETVIFNRTLERAAALAKEFDGKSGRVMAEKWEAFGNGIFDAVINCTPVGMHPQTKASPVPAMPPPKWDEKTVVFDTIYNPQETSLLKLAKKMGAKRVSGVEMFVRQAGLQFTTFTGLGAPVELFRGIVIGALKK